MGSSFIESFPNRLRSLPPNIGDEGSSVVHDVDIISVYCDLRRYYLSCRVLVGVETWNFEELMSKLRDLLHIKHSVIRRLEAKFMEIMFLGPKTSNHVTRQKLQVYYKGTMLYKGSVSSSKWDQQLLYRCSLKRSKVNDCR